MATKGSECKILVDQFDFSTQSAGFTLNIDNKVLDFTTLQATGVSRIPGLGMASIEHNGYHSAPAAGQLEYELNARLGVTSAITVAAILGTGLTLPIAYVLNTTFNSQLKYKAPVANILTVDGMWPNKSDQICRGYRVYTGTISGTGAQTTCDFASAASGSGSKAWLQVQAITGTATNATIKVSSSAASNFSSPTDHGTWSFSSVGMYEVDLTGTLGRYVRVDCTDLGGATDFTVLAIVASKGVTIN